MKGGKRREGGEGKEGKEEEKGKRKEKGKVGRERRKRKREEERKRGKGGKEMYKSAPGPPAWTLKLHLTYIKFYIRSIVLFVCLYLFPYQLKTKEIYNINTLNIQIRKRRITQIQQYSYNTAGLPWGPTLIINILNFKS